MEKYPLIGFTFFLSLALCLSSLHGMAQADKWVGTWELGIGRNKFPCNEEPYGLGNPIVGAHRYPLISQSNRTSNRREVR